MTTKTPTPKRPDIKADEPSPEDLKAAYQIHTLAHLVYGRLAMTNPWVAPPQQWNAPTPAQGLHHGPMTGPIWYR